MATYRNLRRQAEDAQKKYARYNEIMTNYASEVDAYNAKGTEFNEFVGQVKSGATGGVYEYEPGKWATISGDSFSYTTKKGNPWDSSGLYGSVDELKNATGKGGWGGQAGYVKNPDGTATYYSPQQSVSYVDSSGKPIDTQGWTSNGEGGWTPGAGASEYLPPALQEGGASTVVTNEYVAHPDMTRRVMAFNELAPTEPDVEPPKFSLTNSQAREMSNPTMDAAGTVMGEAKGYGVKTSEANAAPSANSALAGLDPEDQFKDKGILARVLGGEI